MIRSLFAVLIFVGALPTMHVSAANTWRPATAKELTAWIPARASVVKERIETESRTASGIVDGQGRYVAGVVLITAGYSANGKYSDFLVTKVPLKIGSAQLQPGEYVFGWRRADDSLLVSFYDAASGKLLGEVQAKRDPTRRRIESFQILPPGEESVMLIGRFAVPYEFTK
jgi:hypothetical protein